MNKKVLGVVFVVMGLSAILTLSACNSGTLAGDVTESEAASAGFTWTTDADCTVCHGEEAASATDANANLCANHGNLACITCHDDTDGLIEAHEDVAAEDTNTPSKLKKTEVSETACLSCHGSWEDLAALTTDVVVLTDVNGLTVNPHEVTTTYMVDGNHEDVSCADCHKMHSGISVDEQAPTVCVQCHHSGVYECYTCHE